MPSETPSPARDALGDPALRRTLVDFVRRRVPSSEVDDVVQTVLLDALAAAGRPADPVELRRWLLGVARHKVVDFHRRAHREPQAELPDIPDSPPPLEARGLARWAEREAGPEGDAQRTLAWMAREGEGEKLEAIAADEKLPAARVRQRVSRMRRWMKERWAAELAAVAVIGAVAVAAWWLLHPAPPVAHELPEVSPTPTIVPEPSAPMDRARTLRAEALRACDQREWRPCLDGLEQARALDPIGDQEPAVGAARASAAAGLRDEAQVPLPTSEAKPEAKPESKSGPAPAPSTTATTNPITKPVAPSVKKPSGENGYSTPSSDPSFGSGSKGSGMGKVRSPKKAMTKVLDSPAFDAK
jgi:DNA-directed RNA polymerase specialized sigma24 family protein